ncbi:uncharacterized protein [Halyomorpha halys]|uniref:uncharacterized protein isoform X2 n=1 Tax=Halyomorpha halys TaxID=286706 RepID=UPI0006D4E173|nr:uncharacterized protein LOC106686003 isoform X2 [Halyomorpha halys]
MMEKPIIFTNLPLSEELCHILVSIDPYEKKDQSVKSDFQWQLLKTRLLLYSEKNIIATPAAGMLRYIHVISMKEYLNSGSLNAIFQKLKLKVESVGTLSLPMYEQCLIYNLLVKLSPFWNKVEKYFVEGRYFLMQRGGLHAIELNIILKGDMLMLYASPLRLWLREVSLFDLLPSSNIEETLSKPFYIDLHSERQWVHVLPSFKRGYLVYVTNRIPKNSTFEDYQQMRRHWKNTYGYRLPEDDSSAIYVGISFFGNNDFLYPLECVRRGMHMNIDEPNVVAHFAKAVATKAALVCGNKIKLMNLSELQNMPKIKTRERLKWSESGLAELDSELLNKWLFQEDDSANMTFESQNISLYMEPEQCHSTKDDPNKKLEYDNWLAKCSQFIDKLNQGGQKRSFLKASRLTFNGTSLPSSPLKVESKSQPSSTIAQIEEDSFLQEKESCQSHPPFKPYFNKIESNVHAKKESVNLSSKEQHEVNINVGSCDGAIFENNFGHRNEITHMNVTPSPDVLFKPIFKKKKSLHSKGAVKTLEERKKVSKSVSKSKSLTSEICSNNRKSVNNEIKKKEKKKKKKKDIKILKENNSVMASEVNIQEVGAEIDVQEAVTEINDICCEKDEQMIEKINLEEAIQNLIEPNHEINLTSNLFESPLADSVQDSMLIEEEERKKPTLLSAIEIENLVLTNQIEKVNVPSLCCYLKGKGIPFSKDKKKDVLLQKVKEIIMPAGK